MKGKGGVKAVVRFAFRAVGLLLHGIFRGLGLIILFLILLGGAAYFTVTRMFQEEELKAAVATQIQEVFHRPVQIDGVILGAGGIKVRGVRILDKPGVPGEPLLYSDFALVSVKLLPLISRRVELDNVKLVAPRIHLYRDPAGNWNVEDLFVSHRTAPSQAGGLVSLPFSLASDHTVIEGGRLMVEDRFRDRRFEIERFNLNITKFDLGLPFSYSVSFDNVSTFSDTKVKTSWAFDGQIALMGFDWNKASLTAPRLKVTVDGRALRGSASVKGFPRSEIEMDIKVPALGASALRPYLKDVPDFWLPASRWTLRFMAVDAQRFLLTKFKLEAPPLTLSASGTLQAGAAPEFSADLNLSEFPLGEAQAFLPQAARLRLKGAGQARASLSGWLNRVVLKKGRLALRDASAVFKDQPVSAGSLDIAASDDFETLTLSASRGATVGLGNSFTDISLVAALNKKDLKVDKLSLKWSGSALDLKARVKDITDPKEVMVKGTLDRLRWEDGQRLFEDIVSRLSTPPAGDNKPWVKTFKYAIPRKFPDTIGHIVIGKITQKNFDGDNMDLVWDIKGVSPSLKYVSGEARLTFGPGHISDIPALQKSHKLLNYVFLPYLYMFRLNKLAKFSAATAYAKSFDFDQIGAQYGLKNGVAATRYFFVDSPQHKVYYDGTADFGNEKVDMTILTRLAKAEGQLPYTLSDEAGRPAIGFRVKGNMNDPDVEFRLNKMKANEIERNKQEGMARAGALVKIEERLRDL